MSSSPLDEFETAIETAKQRGYREREGRWETPDGTVLSPGVDPKPLQEAAIKIGFDQATEEADFDIWTVVDRSIVREGRHINHNFKRVVDEFQAQSEDVAEEVARQLDEMGEDLMAGAENE